MLDSDIAALDHVSVFANLSPAAMEGLREKGFAQTEPRGARIFEQGELPRFLHVVLRGRLALIGATDDDRKAVIEFFGPGEVVIAPAVLLELPYLMSGVLTEESRLFYLPAQEARELTRSDTQFCRNMALMLARHWRLLANQIKDHKLKSAPQRLAAYLLGGARMSQGRLVIELAVDKRSLASRLGMTPENLSRNLSQLEKFGVRVAGRHVEIADPERLRAFCHDDGLV